MGTHSSLSPRLRGIGQKEKHILPKSTLCINPGTVFFVFNLIQLGLLVYIVVIIELKKKYTYNLYKIRITFSFKFFLGEADKEMG